MHNIVLVDDEKTILNVQSDALNEIGFNIVPIRIPALRERPDNIEPLAHHFFKTLRGKLPAGSDKLSGEALAILQAFSMVR